MDRRAFIGKSCLLCFSLAGLAVTGTALSGCAGVPSVSAKAEGKTVRVAQDAFKESNLLIVRTSQLPFDILLIKNNTTITALYLQCSHQENPLTVSKTGLNCPAHGSRFDFEGKPTAPPATTPLQRFTTTIDNSTILIHLTA